MCPELSEDVLAGLTCLVDVLRILFLRRSLVLPGNSVIEIVRVNLKTTMMHGSKEPWGARSLKAFLDLRCLFGPLRTSINSPLKISFSAAERGL